MFEIICDQCGREILDDYIKSKDMEYSAMMTVLLMRCFMMSKTVAETTKK